MIEYSPQNRTATSTETGETLDFYCGENLTRDAIVILQVAFGLRSAQHAYIDILTRGEK